MPETNLVKLGKLLKAARKKRKLTQEKLSALTVASPLQDVAVRTISKIEHGEENPSFETLLSLVTFLGVSLDSLLCPSDDEAASGLQEITGFYNSCPPDGQRMIVYTTRALAKEILGEHQS